MEKVCMDMFGGFIGKNIKAAYRDGDQIKFARGILESAEGGLLRITGRLGTLIINTETIQKLGLSSK